MRRVVALVLLITAVSACRESAVEIGTQSPSTSLTLPDLSDLPVTPDDRPPIVTIPDLLPDPDRPALQPSGGVWFRLFLRQVGGPVDQLSLDIDGVLVGIEDLSVFGGPADAWQRQLSDAGFARALALVEATGGVGFDGTCCLEPTPGLAEALLDPGFLDAEAGPQEPWTPDSLTVFVQPPDITAAGRPGPPAPWPLSRRLVGDHDGTASLPYTDDAPYHCLVGDEAAAVWALLGQGQSSAWIPADDGSGRYLLRVDVQWPGYRLYGDPCG